MLVAETQGGFIKTTLDQAVILAKAGFTIYGVDVRQLNIGDLESSTEDMYQDVTAFSVMLVPNATPSEVQVASL